MKPRLSFLIAAAFFMFSCNNSDSGRISIYQSADSVSANRSLSICLGETVDFVGDSWGSVGISFDVKFDSAYFDMSESMQYKHPENMGAGMCGGDEATLTVSLKPLKPGQTTVSCINGFRGQDVNQVNYNISIE